MINEQEIIDLYKSGLTGYEIEKKVGYCHGYIYQILKKNNIELVDPSISHSKYDVNRNIFNNINIRWKAYFVGMIFGDGNLSKIGRISIGLLETDRNVLDFFNEKILNNSRILTIKEATTTKGLNGKIYNIKSKVCFEVTCQQITKDLRKIGLHENKSHTIKYPLFNGFEGDFIRGIFDSDGCIYYNQKEKRKELSLIGSKYLMESIRNILDKNGMHFNPVGRMSSIYRLRTSKLDMIKNFYNFIYQNGYDVCLERKRQKFHEVFDYFK